MLIAQISLVVDNQYMLACKKNNQPYKIHENNVQPPVLSSHICHRGPIRILPMLSEVTVTVNGTQVSVPSGTTVAVAQRLKRKWVGIDITYLSTDLV